MIITNVLVDVYASQFVIKTYLLGLLDYLYSGFVLLFLFGYLANILYIEYLPYISQNIYI